MVMKPRIIIKTNPMEQAITAADTLAMTAIDRVKENRLFTVAISGGSTPRTMHRMLTKVPYWSDIPWKNTHIFWVDERCVPQGHPDSNYGTAGKDFLTQVPISRENVHPMNGEAPPEASALKYQDELRDFFQLEHGDFPIFDLVFLGMGADGHTASLFPHQKALDEAGRWVVAVKGGAPYVSRLTMTFPVLNNAGQVVFLISGKEKAPTLKNIFENNEILLPVQRIQPYFGELVWILDREAASLLAMGKGHRGEGTMVR